MFLVTEQGTQIPGLLEGLVDKSFELVHWSLRPSLGNGALNERRKKIKVKPKKKVQNNKNKIKKLGLEGRLIL